MQSIPDAVLHLAVDVDERRVERNRVVRHCDPDRRGYGCVHAHGFTDDGVEVRKLVQLVYGWVLGRDVLELLAQLLLYLGCLR